MTAVASQTAESATSSMVRLGAGRVARCGGGTELSAGHCPEKQSRTSALLLPPRQREPPPITATICRNLARMLTTSSMPLDHIASALVYRSLLMCVSPPLVDRLRS